MIRERIIDPVDIQKAPDQQTAYPPSLDEGKVVFEAESTPAYNSNRTTMRRRNNRIQNYQRK